MIDVREQANSTSNTTSDSIYENYEEDIHSVWGGKLIKEFFNQRRMYLHNAFGVYELEVPTFNIDNASF